VRDQFNFTPTAFRYSGKDGHLSFEALESGDLPCLGMANTAKSESSAYAKGFGSSSPLRGECAFVTIEMTPSTASLNV
jgi:hypothetical protein